MRDKGLLLRSVKGVKSGEAIRLDFDIPARQRDYAKRKELFPFSFLDNFLTRKSMRREWKVKSKSWVARYFEGKIACFDGDS